MTDDVHSLLDPQFLKRLEQLEVGSRRLVRGTYSGSHRSRSLGESVEFADYREYSPGDDLRQIDWFVYARTHKWFLKTFLDERELVVSLYIDTTRSMAFGSPYKGQRALQLAAALGYITLHRLDRVQLFTFGPNARRVLPLQHGKRTVPRLLASLQQLTFIDKDDGRGAIIPLSVISRQPGLSIVLTDGWMESGLTESLSRLQGTKQHVTLVQLTTAAERQPNYEGDLRLIDSETGISTEVAMSPTILKQYRRTYREYTDRLRQWCFRRGIGYIPVAVEEPLETVVFSVFRQAGLVRG